MTEFAQIGDAARDALEWPRKFWTCPKTNVECHRANRPVLFIDYQTQEPRMYAGIESAPDETTGYVVPCYQGMTPGEVLAVMLYLAYKRALDVETLLRVIDQIVVTLGDDRTRSIRYIDALRLREF